MNAMDGKSQAWRDAADTLLEALARENKFVVADMVIIFLESAGYGLDDYAVLGGVFKRAANRGIIKRVDRNGKQALWSSCIYSRKHHDLKEGEIIHFRGFGDIDKVTYQIAEVSGETMRLERLS